MSLLYLQFEGGDRTQRVARLERSGARVIVAEPKWPGFFELAKKEKPYAIALDFSRAPSHALETADYIAKAKETKETPLYLLQVPEDRLDLVAKRLPQAGVVTEQELSGRLAEIEREAELRARQKKQAAAEARREKRSRTARGAPEKAASAAPARPSRPAPPKPRKPAAKPAPAAKKKPAKPAKPAKKAGAKSKSARPAKKK
jgi:hypothetical protein